MAHSDNLRQVLLAENVLRGAKDNTVWQTLRDTSAKIDGAIAMTIESQRDMLVRMSKERPQVQHLSPEQLSNNEDGYRLCPCCKCFGDRLERITDIRTPGMMVREVDEDFNETDYKTAADITEMLELAQSVRTWHSGVRHMDPPTNVCIGPRALGDRERANSRVDDNARVEDCSRRGGNGCNADWRP